MSLTALLLSTSAAAQQPRACFFDTLRYTRVETLTLGLAPGWRQDADKPSPPDYLTAAEAIQANYLPPAQVRLPLWARTKLPGESDTTEYIGFGLDGHLRFRLDSAGHLANDSIEIGSASPDVVASVAAAIARADSAGDFPRPSRDVRRDGGAIVLRFVDAPRTRGLNVALLRLRIPAINIQAPPEVVHGPQLEYPEGLRRAGVSGRVVVQFIVQADGTPDTTYVEVLQATYRDFATTMLRGIKNLRFRPAAIDGCPMPLLVRVPFDFQIRQ